MALAVDRDLVARQYVNGYADVFRNALPAFQGALAAGQPLETAIVTAYLSVLACYPDSLIARKRGLSVAQEATRRAAAVLSAGWPDHEEAISRCGEFDAWLRADGHARNPGATADLITATLYAALREGIIPLPRPVGSEGWDTALRSESSCPNPDATLSVFPRIA
jgi:triphosphoribosyl-dephospho-CoA synthase